MVVESDEEGSKKALKKTQLNFLSSQDKMYLNYIFGFTWAAAAVHEVLLADGFDDQDHGLYLQRRLPWNTKWKTPNN